MSMCTSATVQRLDVGWKATRPARGEWLMIAGIVAAAALLRFGGIENRSLWFDEAYSLHMASREPRLILQVVSREDTHPPLYYLLLSGWIKAFGTGEAALRSLGVTASILAVGGTWWLGRRLGGAAVGAAAAFLAATSPFQVLAAQEARMYPLLGLLTLCSWAMLLQALDGKRWAWAGYVAGTALAVYTHYFAFLTLVGQGIFVLAAAPRIRRPWLASQAAVALLFLPWLPSFAATYTSGRGWPFFRPPVGPGSVTSLLGMWSFGGHALGFDGWFGGATAPLAAQLAVLIPFLVLAALGWEALRRYPPATWFVFCYLVIPVALVLLVSLRQNVYYARYFSYLYPAFAVLLASGMVRLGSILKPAAPRTVVLAAILVSLGFSAPVLNDIYTHPRLSVHDWRAAARLVTQRARHDDIVVVIPATGYLPFMYYFRGSQWVVPLTPREFLEIRTGRITEDPAAEARSRALFRSFAAAHEGMWLVITGPFPDAAMDRLRLLVSSLYEVRSKADFRGVVAFETTRRRDWQGAP